MQQITHQELLHCPSTTPFRLLIAWEDQASFLRARKVQNDVETLFGEEIPISRTFWNFSLLRHKQLLEHAIVEAAGADMIVISVCGGGTLPSHVVAWVNGWPARRETGQAALVALIGPLEENASAQPVIAYLRRVSGSHGMDFFCNQDGLGPVTISEPSVSPENDPMSAQDVFDVRAVPLRHWGIND